LPAGGAYDGEKGRTQVEGGREFLKGRMTKRGTARNKATGPKKKARKKPTTKDAPA